MTPDNRTAHDECIDLGRITVDHQIMGGVGCVTGTRIPVATIVGLVANGLTTNQIVAEYPQPERTCKCCTPSRCRPATGSLNHPVHWAS
jgi:uncharacterized protein (DUF433 family)